MSLSLSWNEIRSRAATFAVNWKDATRERAEAAIFWHEFFAVFGIGSRGVASFEEPVRKLAGNWGYIDCFWPEVMLAEHKSLGKDLGKAHAQGMEYVRGLIDSGRGKELPRYLAVSDFRRFALHDLEAAPGSASERVEFTLAELPEKIHFFGFIAGYRELDLSSQFTADEHATHLMSELHDTFQEAGYGVGEEGTAGHDLKRLLVRLLFCLFADDTGIFDAHDFTRFLIERTADDGSDLGGKLASLFQTLNTPVKRRQKNLDQHLAGFPYVNGDLFDEKLPIAEWSSEMRAKLLSCCKFDWSRISPAIFGSLFQSVMNKFARRQIGAHYTSEASILRLIRPLFLDELRAELAAAMADRSKRRQARLQELQNRLASLTFFDPACGCGNFLVITYRELRQIELEVLVALHPRQQRMTLDDIETMSKLDVDRFFGIEIEEFPARIAEVAMWLADHQANVALGKHFSTWYCRIPLRKRPKIVIGNALVIDWATVIPAQNCSYVLGNPPFVGHHLQSPRQKADQLDVLRGISASGVMDYVANWFMRAVQFVQGTAIRVAFVATNSIAQGEQPGILWAELFRRYVVKIQFAYRTFVWDSESRGRAHVHVVIIGFGAADRPEKYIYELQNDGTAVAMKVKNISPYVFEGNDAVLPNRSRPLCDVPAMQYGSKPTDDGNFILSTAEKDALLASEPLSAKYIKPYLGAREVLDGAQRWCLWLGDVTPTELKKMPEVSRRVEAIRQFRLKSDALSTQEYAEFPTRFRQIAQPTSDFILIPGHTSENRAYIPFAFFGPENVVSNSCFFVPDASLYHFGIISSEMHMGWVRQFCGRLESRFRYSKDIVYNNFPWPQEASETQIKAVEKAAQSVLDARAAFPESSLSEMYSEMLPALTKAHAALDRAVDRCYRKEPLASERLRVEYLFALYEKLNAALIPGPPPVRRSRGGAGPNI